MPYWKNEFNTNENYKYSMLFLIYLVNLNNILNNFSNLLQIFTN